MKKIKSVKKYETGGAKDENCWPGKPGCGYKKAQKKNARKKFWNSDTGKTIKKIGTAVGALGAVASAYTKNVGGIKDKIQDLKENKKGGSVKTKRSVGSTSKRKK